MTKLQQLTGALLEAGWLIAVVIAALFLNPFSRQVFDPTKVFLLRSLALVLLAGLVIHALETHERIREIGAGLLQAVPRTPFVGLISAFVLVHGVATLLSVARRVSFWGSYERMQGTYTLLSYVVLFVAVRLTLRRRDQLERLVTVLLAISFPVALYGVAQHFDITLLEFTGQFLVVRERVISTIGNAIFLAAYLAMVVPLTLWRLTRRFQEWRAGRAPWAALAVVMYALLLGLQLLCMVFTQSRGPLLGLAIALFFMLFLMLLEGGRRRWAWGLIAAGTLGFLFLAALNMPALPLDRLRQLPYLTRFSYMATDPPTGSVLRRALAWESTLSAVTASPRRLVFGYGPETMRLVFDRFIVAELVPQLGERYFDRAHNGVFDALFSTGVVGAAAYLLLFGVVFYRAYVWLGLVVTARDRGALAGLMVAGAGLGGLASAVFRGDFAFAGVGVSVGLLGGLFLYLVSCLVRHLPSGAVGDRPEQDTLLLVALLAAVIGHFAEGITGIGTVSTRVHFWLYLALMIRVGEREAAAEQAAGRAARRRGRRVAGRRAGGVDEGPAGLGALVALSFVVAVMLAGLVFAFVHGFNTPGAQGPAVGLIAATWLFSGGLILLERRRVLAGAQRLGQEVAVYALATLAWTLPFGLYYAGRVKTAGVLDESLVVFTAWLFLTLIAAAVAWRAGRLTSSLTLARGVRAAIYPIVAVLVLVFIWVSNVTPMRADVHAKIGEVALGAGQRALGVESLQRAVQLNPDQARYYLLLGDAYLEQAELASDTATREAWLEQAQQAFQYGWALAPGNSEFPQSLGSLHRTWARMSAGGATQRARLETSLRYYLAAAELSPRSPRARMALAEGYFALGNHDAALAEYQRVVDLGFRDRLAEAYAGLGDVYVAQGQLSEAADAYRRAMRVGHRSQHVLQVRRSLVDSYPQRTEFRIRLALLYAGQGRREEALQELETALNLATGQERAEVEQLIRMLEE